MRFYHLIAVRFTSDLTICLYVQIIETEFPGLGRKVFYGMGNSGDLLFLAYLQDGTCRLPCLLDQRLKFGLILFFNFLFENGAVITPDVGLLSRNLLQIGQDGFICLGLGTLIEELEGGQFTELPVMRLEPCHHLDI